MSQSFRIVLFLLLLASIATGGSSCRAAQVVEPPQIDYPQLLRHFADRQHHFPLTSHFGSSDEATSSANGVLYYVRKVDGVSNIWIRESSTTLESRLIHHPSSQHSPTTSGDGRRLIFVSEQLNVEGELHLVQLNPVQLLSALRRGVQPPNYWDHTLNLSSQLKSFESELPEECRHSSGESSPLLSHDGLTLYFISDRCDPDLPNLWRARLDRRGRITATPEQISRRGAAQPTLSRNGRLLAYISYPANRPGGVVVVHDLESGEESVIETPAGSTDFPFVYLRPTLSDDGSSIFYISVREDTNRNRIADPGDHAAIYGGLLRRRSDSKGFARFHESQLIDSSRPIHHLTFSPLAGGTLIYSASHEASSNLYLLQPEGVIAQQQNIGQQFQLAASFKDETIQRHLLALDSVGQYHGDHELMLLYAPRVLIAKLRRYASENMRPGVDGARRELRRIGESNPIATLLLLVEESRMARRLPLRELQQGIARIESALPVDLSIDSRRYIIASLRHELARELIGQRRWSDARTELRRVVEVGQDYHSLREAEIELAEIDLRVDGGFPESYRLLLRRDDLSYRDREQITMTLFRHFERVSENELSQLSPIDGVPPIGRSILDAARAAQLHESGEWQRALEQATAAISRLPEESGLAIRMWQLIAGIQEQLGNTNEAYGARLRYGGAYRRDSLAHVSVNEYIDIVEQSDQFTNRYLHAAREIYTLIEQREDSILAGLVPMQALLPTTRLQLRAGERDLLREFCQPGSQGASLLLTLGQQEYVRRFQSLCSAAPRELAHQEGVPLENAQEAADLFYLVSYANVNMINLLFMHMARVELFADFQREKSIHYHKLKIDIAVERNQRRLGSEQRVLIRLRPSDLQNLISGGDPFDATIFNELQHSYRMISEEARRYNDMTILYGYAYLLIRKSVERERFYDDLLRGGVAIPDQALRRMRQRSLMDFKTAEYQLRYVLNIDPSNSDAHLLLGWMYHYIDQRRERILPREPGYIERGVNWLAGIHEPRQSEGAIFRDLYAAYFADQLYESNVQIYRQALEHTPAHEESSRISIHLNLANTYSVLLNFSQAERSYESVYRAKQERNYAFNDYRREALFHYNYGRALFFNRRTAEAAHLFAEAEEIYQRYELRPVEERLQTLRFLSDNEQLDGNEQRRIELERLERNHASSRVKLALIHAMRGLSLLETGDYDGSILAFRHADMTLFDSGTIPNNALQRSGIYNYIALAQKSRGSYSRSLEAAQRAWNEAEQSGFEHNQRRFQAETLGGRLLGILLGYGEDFSVIGDGRTPFGFSELRQSHLSSGIQLENHILQNDFHSAEQLLRERVQRFQRSESGRRLGREAIIASHNQQGWHYYRQRRFGEAEESFAKAVAVAERYGFDAMSRLNQKNRYYALFGRVERGLQSHQTDLLLSERELKQAQREIDNYIERYSARLRQRFIEERESELRDYQFDEELDGDHLAARLGRELQELQEARTLLLYYIGRLIEFRALSSAELFEANRLYQQALRDIERIAVDNLSSESRTSPLAAFRLQLNRARLLHAAGRYPEALEEYERLFDLASELGLTDERLEGLWGSSSLYDSLYQLSGDSADLRRAIESGERAAAQLLEHNWLYHKSRNGYSSELRLVAHLQLLSGASEPALELLELEREIALERALWQLPSLSQGPSAELGRPLSLQLRRAQQTMRNWQEMAQQRARHQAARQSTQPQAASRITELRKSYHDIKGELRGENDEWRPFLVRARLMRTGEREAMGRIAGRGGERARRVTLFGYRDQLHLWQESGRERRYQSLTRSEESLTAQMAELSEKVTERNEELFLVADRSIEPYPLERWSAAPLSFLYSRSESPILFADREDEVAALLQSNPRLFTHQKEEIQLLNGRWPKIAAIDQLFEPYSIILLDRGSIPIDDEIALIALLRQSGVGSLLRLPSNGGINGVTISTERRLRDQIDRRAGTSHYAADDAEWRLYGSGGYSMVVARPLLEQHLVAQLQQIEQDIFDLRQFRRARRLLRSADSLAQQLDDSEAKGRTELFALLFSSHRREPGSLDRFLQLADRTTAANSDSYRLHRQIVLSLYLLNEIERAHEALSRAARMLSDEQTSRLALEAATVDFIARVRRPIHYIVPRADPLLATQSFDSSFHTVRDSLARHPLGRSSVRHLIERQRYDEAEELLRRIGSRQHRESRALERRIAIERIWLEGEVGPRGAAPDELLDLAEDGGDLLLRRFRQNLHATAQDRGNGRPYRIDHFENRLTSSGQPVYSQIDPVERTILLRVLIDSIEFDTGLASARMLQQLVHSEYEHSTIERATSFALYSADALLRRGDARAARPFHDFYQGIAFLSSNRRSLQLLEAKVGLTLRLVAADSDSQRQLDRWRDIVAAAPGGEVYLQRLLLFHAAMERSSGSEAELQPLLTELSRGVAHSVERNQRTAVEGSVVWLRLLQQRLVQEERWETILSLARYEQELQMRILSGGGSAPLYSQRVGRLRQRLPEGQRFVAMVDLVRSASRITLERNQPLRVDVMSQSGRLLAGRTSEYLSLRRNGEMHDDLYRRVAMDYRALVSLQRDQVGYLWRPGVHALAPIHLERGERIYKVHNIDAFLRNPYTSDSAAYPSRFQLDVRGRQRSADPYHRRLQTMEELSFGRRGSGSLHPQHVALPPTRAGLNRVSGVLGQAPGWLYAGDWSDGNRRVSIEEYRLFLHQLGESAARPGVVAMPIAMESEFALFTHYYYSRTLPFANTYKRYEEAMMSLRRRMQQRSDHYGLQLMTPAMIER